GLVSRGDLVNKSADEIIDLVTQAAEQRYEQKEAQFAEHGADMRDAERAITLKLIDDKWVEHLNSMDYLREGIYLRGYAQQDPLVAYKKKAYEMFRAPLKSTQDDMVSWMFHLFTQPARPQPVRRRIFTPVSEEGEMLPAGNGHGTVNGTERKAGRN